MSLYTCTSKYKISLFYAFLFLNGIVVCTYTLNIRSWHFVWERIIKKKEETSAMLSNRLA